MRIKSSYIPYMLIAILLIGVSFTSTRETTYKNRSELDLLYAKARSENKELQKFEDQFQNFSAKVNAQRIRLNQKISSRERLHQQAKAMINSIRSPKIKQHAQTIQTSYYKQLEQLKKKKNLKFQPLEQELAISRDWMNALKITYALEENRKLEKLIEEELKNQDITEEKLKEINAKAKALVTQLLTPAD